MAHPASARSLEDFRIRNFKVGGEFTLTDQFGRKAHLKQFRDKVLLLAFGFTHCTDICPATVSTMNRVLKKLGKRAGSARMVFITVDPERDTPPVIKKYLANFNKDIIGLTGKPGEVEDVAIRYASPFRKIQSKSKAGYQVAHAGFYYLLNKDGKVAYILPHDAGAEMLLRGVKTLLK